MKNAVKTATSCAAALLFCAAAAAAQPGMTPQAPLPQATTSQHPAEPLHTPVKYSEEMRATLKDLALLLDRGAEVPPERLDALIPELKKFRDDLRTAIGGEILAQEAVKEDRARSEAAKQTLQGLRSSLQVYYIEHDGRYPKTPADLVPSDLPSVPWLELPGHARTNAITVINSRKYDRDVSKAVTDSGGWLYFSDPASVNYGLLVIDCRHREAGGGEFYKY